MSDGSEAGRSDSRKTAWSERERRQSAFEESTASLAHVKGWQSHQPIKKQNSQWAVFQRPDILPCQASKLMKPGNIVLKPSASAAPQIHWRNLFAHCAMELRLSYENRDDHKKPLCKHPTPNRPFRATSSSFDNSLTNKHSCVAGNNMCSKVRSKFNDL